MRIPSSVAKAVLVGALFSTSMTAKAAEVVITARLISIEPQAGCGYLHVGSLAKYLVLAGPQNLVSTEIEVFVPCAEMPRIMYSPDAGDLQRFEVGATHDLTLSRKNDSGATLTLQQNHSGIYFLRAASSNVERTRDR
ncbi:hypothetical protein [Undibacterium sp. Ji22W]|uniref:hypothetical protein n=1 Tax=Undibacterium sp. Ji22W TaxID=3413038 RepID=UPI003BF21AC4